MMNSNTPSMSNLENIPQLSEPYSEKTLKQSRYDGRTLTGLAPQTNLPAHRIEIWNTINKKSFCQI